MESLTLDKADLKDRTIFFTSDLHFGHKKIIPICNRPFEDIDEMDQGLINNWNSVVKENDLVFILGDFCFRKKLYWIEVLSKLKGLKYLILGNHDDPKNIPYQCFVDVKDMLYLNIYKQTVTSTESEYDMYDHLFLCHYPILSFPGMFRDTYQLYGHVHTRENNTGSDKDLLQYLIKSYDVGVDNNNYTPISYRDVMEKLQGICIY